MPGSPAEGGEALNLNKENTKKIMLLIAFTVLLYVGLQNLHIVWNSLGYLVNLLFPFLLGGGIAFVLNVPMNFFENKVLKKRKERKYMKKLRRPMSLVLALALVAALLLLVIFVVAPVLGETVITLGKRIEEQLPVFQKWLMNIFQDNEQIEQWISELDIDIPKIANSVWDVLRNGAGDFLNSTISVTMGLVNSAVNFGIGFIFACYILLSKEKLTVQVKKAFYAIFPTKAADYLCHVGTLANKTFSSFATGQCIEAVILGMMFFVTMTIFRFPYAMLVGVLISFTALIPIFGGIIGCWISFFIILIDNPIKAVLFLALFVTLQQIEGNLIYPHVVGGSVGLPSIWVLMAVTVGGSLMGIVGMLVFIPLVSVVYSLFREWTYGRLKEKGVKEEKWQS